MTGEQLIELERATVAAFKDKRGGDFVSHFSDEYIGVANDGVKTAEGELKGMRGLDLDSIEVEDARVSFPVANIGIVTYKMVVAGRHGRDPVEGAIYSSTVYVQFGENWKVVLHTESMAPPAD